MAKQTEENSAIKWITYETWPTHFKLLAKNLLHSYPKKIELTEPTKWTKETYETGQAARTKLKTRIQLPYGETETTQNFCIIFCGFFHAADTLAHICIYTYMEWFGHTQRRGFDTVAVGFGKKTGGREIIWKVKRKAVFTLFPWFQLQTKKLQELACIHDTYGYTYLHT